MNTDAGSGIGGTTLSPLPPGHLLRAAAFTPAVRGYPGGIADMTGEEEGLAGDEFAVGGPGGGWTGGGVAGGSVAGGGVAGGGVAGGSAAGGSGAGTAGSVWQQSLAVWREAHIDWLREGRVQPNQADRTAAESDQHNTEPIPVVTGLESPETLGKLGTSLTSGASGAAGTTGGAGAVGVSGAAGRPDAEAPEAAEAAKAAEATGSGAAVSGAKGARPAGNAGARPAGKGAAGARPAGKGAAGARPAGKGAAGARPAGEDAAGEGDGGTEATLDEDLIVLSGSAPTGPGGFPTAPEAPAADGPGADGPGADGPGTGAAATGAVATDAVATGAAEADAAEAGAAEDATPGTAAKPGTGARARGGKRHPGGPPGRPGGSARPSGGAGQQPRGARKPAGTASKLARAEAGGAGTQAAAGPSGAGASGRALRGSRTKIVAVAAGVALIAGAIVGIAVASSGGPAAPPSFGLVTPYPPAVLADGAFAPQAAGPGLPPTLTTVASSGHTVIAAGSQGGVPLSLPLFLVSLDGGHTWARAPLSHAGAEASGAVTGSGAVPVIVARGRASWLALGQQAAWTSTDGTAWQPVTGPPMETGDKILGLARTRTGFLAVGENVPGPAGTGVPSPVLWTTANGQTWQRKGAAALTLRATGGLDAGGGSMVSLRWAAYRAGVIIVGGEISRPVVQHHGKRKVIVPTESPGLWRSTNNGVTWHTVGVPVNHGAAAGVSGLTASGPGFMVIRPGHSLSGRRDAVAFLSANGFTWHYAGRLTAGPRAPLHVITVAASDQGFVVAGTTGASRVAFVSARGHGWRKTADQGTSTSTSVTGVTVTPGSAVLAAGARHQPGSVTAGATPYLLLAGAGPGARRTLVGQPVLAASGTADVTVNSIGAAGGLRVAAGSANGAPALWRQASGRWQPERLPVPASWTPGSLTSVVSGAGGWLAIGHTGSLGPVTPAPSLAPTVAAKAVSSVPVIIISRNGKSWRPATGTQEFSGPDTAFAQAAAGPAGYVIVGSVTGLDGKPGPAAWHSAGLDTWQRAAVRVAGPDAAGASAGPQQMLGVTSVGSRFAAVGSTGNLPAVWTSQTGSAWQLSTLPLPTGAASAVLTSVAAVGQRVVALGTAVHATGPGHPLPAPMPFTATSSDGGRTWRETVPQGRASPAAVTALTAAGKGFVAAGLSGPPGHQAMVVWWSSDGRTWRGGQAVRGPAGAQGTAQLTALNAAGGTLTGAGYAVTGSGEHPLRWQARFR